ncbi:hypothetical protein [Lacticaseibacillus thailandensis]|uniref:Uncharacterized protein n=1 Tax=Lacticaseibacillus thailandensis DSM 22698 = JCM 13996 TaxID=1423810 RepID=A0A0R2C8I8_9LACO|nr:hypothetical protein [Lacticaseibacillus thailandensis]KRM88062.1 hypothetical protein FD19_GL000346 [Lacticaseibacillus thailandensis DSM 22698 = JCM 13996]
MLSRKDLHELAQRWASWFADSDNRDAPVSNINLTDELQGAGLVADNFVSVPVAFRAHLVFDDGPAAVALLDAFDDPLALGNSIAARWEQISHWLADGELDHSSWWWLTRAFQRLATLTLPLVDIRTIIIESFDGAFGRRTEDAIVAQKVTVNRDGSMVKVDQPVQGPPRTHHGQVDAQALAPLLTALADLAGAGTDDWSVMDAGNWELTVVSTTGRQRRTGPLIVGEDQGLSERLRDLLHVSGLLLMDGAPHRLQRFSAHYQPAAKVQEDLVLRRGDQSVSFTHQGPTRQVQTRVVDESVGRLLDLLADSSATEVTLLADPADNLTVTWNYRDKAAKSVHGTLNQDHPIPAWGEVAAILRTWMSSVAPAMLDPHVINLPTAKQDEILYAQVLFPHGDRAYSYLATTDYVVGDRVVVPVGGDGEADGIIVNLQYYAPSEAPFPPDRTKAILRKADPLGVVNEWRNQQS